MRRSPTVLRRVKKRLDKAIQTRYLLLRRRPNKMPTRKLCPVVLMQMDPPDVARAILHMWRARLCDALYRRLIILQMSTSQVMKPTP